MEKKYIYNILNEIRKTMGVITEKEVQDAILNKKMIRTKSGGQYAPVILRRGFAIGLNNESEHYKIPLSNIDEIYDLKEDDVLMQENDDQGLEKAAFMALVNGEISEEKINKNPTSFQYNEFDGDEDDFIKLDRDCEIKWEYMDNIFRIDIPVYIEIDYTAPTYRRAETRFEPSEIGGDSATVQISLAGNDVYIDNITKNTSDSIENMNDELKLRIDNFLMKMDGISYEN